MDYASLPGIECAILSLDQEKAFDRVDWGFLKATLVKMGFGPSFSGWIDLFYNGSQSAVMLMAISLLSFPCHVVSARVARCHHSCMC